jgi:PAS domain S-box-containing protein
MGADSPLPEEWNRVAAAALEAAMATCELGDFLQPALQGLLSLFPASGALLARSCPESSMSWRVEHQIGKLPGLADRVIGEGQRVPRTLVERANPGIFRYEASDPAGITWRLMVSLEDETPPQTLPAVAAELLRLSMVVSAATQRHVREHEARTNLESLVEATGAGVWEWDVQSGHARMNARWASIAGYSLEALGPLSVDTWVGLVHPDDLPHCSSQIQAHLAGSVPRYEATYRVRHRDGHWVWVHDCGRVVRYASDGRPELMIGSQIDISRAKEAEEALRLSHQALRTYSALLDAAGRLASVGGWSYLPGDSGPLWSDEVCRIHDVEPGFRPGLEQAIGFYTEACRPQIEAAVRGCLADGTPWDLELEIITAKGRRRWVRAQGEAEREGEQVRMLRGAFQDITERRALLAELESSKDELEERVRLRTAELESARRHAEDASRAKDEFLTNISHELRSPLHSVLGFVGLALDELEQAEPATLRRFLEKSRASASELLKLVNDLLDAAKIESGRLTIQTESISLVSISDAVITEFEVAAANKGLLLERCYADSSTVVADPVRLAQALRNVLANAIRFSPRGGRVGVETRGCGPGLLRLEISDQGPGIPADELEAVFDRFTQSSRTKTGAGGTGLGLPIARGILELHGGRLWAERLAQGGSRFVMELPCA